MNVVLISTSNLSAGRSEALDRMLHSVSNTVARRPDVPIKLLLLLQECESSSNFPAFVDATSLPHRVSLSAARNILLSRALSRHLIEPATVVGFPDDDAWYPEGTLDYVVGQFARAPALDLWFCRYSRNPVAPTRPAFASRPAQARDVIRQASSNTMFTRGRVVLSGASFDEGLGVGTPIGGAEDTDFALRAYILGRQSMYLDAPAIGHRDKNRQLRAKYYRGGLLAIARHARQRKAVAAELARKIAVGGWLTLRRELSPAEFRAALSAAISALRSNGAGREFAA
jgi:hypothetical protein